MYAAKIFIMTKIIFLFSLLSLSFLNQGQALAMPARIVYSSDAQGIDSQGVTLEISDGYGLTIDFIPTNEIIKQAWIADPSHIGFSSNGSLCAQNQEDCQSSGATILFLRKIKPIKFPNLTSSRDGSTELTVISQDANGQEKEYQFRIVPTTKQPKFTNLVIKPDSEKPLPILPRPSGCSWRYRGASRASPMPRVFSQKSEVRSQKSEVRIAE